MLEVSLSSLFELNKIGFVQDVMIEKYFRVWNGEGGSNKKVICSTSKDKLAENSDNNFKLLTERNL